MNNARREIILVTLAGAMVVLAFGDRAQIGGHDVTLPFAALRHYVPGSWAFARPRAAPAVSWRSHFRRGRLDALLRARRPAARTSLRSSSRPSSSPNRPRA